MKKILLAITAALVSAVPIPSSADTNPPKAADKAPAKAADKAPPKFRENVQQRLDWMEKELGLSKEQKGKLQPILQERHDELVKFLAANRKSDKRSFEKITEIAERHEKKIRAVLTPDQLKKRGQLRKAMMKSPPAVKEATKK